jgi:ATP-dependent Clp protease ATP-binding subunit ClpB
VEPEVTTPGAELDPNAERGYDPAYGARPLKRAITRYLETPLAREIIAGEIPDGSTIDVAVDGDRLTFTPVIEGEVVDAG